MMGKFIGWVVAIAVVAAVAWVPVAAAVPQSVPKSLDAAMSAYDMHDFRRAATLARIAADRAQGLERETGRYLEGLALYRAGDMDPAATALRTASTSGDRFVAGQANITLGSVEIARKNYDAAGHAYRRAAVLLDGAESKRAHSFAARCFDASDLTSLAESERAAAGEPVKLVAPAPSAPTKVPAAIEPKFPVERKVVTREDKPKPPIVPVRYTIQVGAFSSAKRANEVAGSLRNECLKIGAGAPRVIARESDGGETLHIVQIGSFSNKSEAGKMAGRLPKSAYRIEVYLPDSAADASSD